MRLDGKKVTAVVNVAVTEGSKVKVSELASQYWAEIGITAVVKPTSNRKLHTMVESSENDITVFHLDHCGESFGARGNPRVIEFIISIPTIPFWMALSTALPKDWPVIEVYFGLTIILSLFGWCWLARVVCRKANIVVIEIMEIEQL